MADFRIEAFPPELPRLPQLGQIQPPSPLGEKELVSRQELSFREAIKNFIHDVDRLQKESGKKIEDFMAGEISNVHEVMIAVEKAATSFQLLMELRNKMLDAYQELKRMSV